MGKRIYENVLKEAWQAWVRHQTMLINENRLNLADPRAREYLSQQMESYFFRIGCRPAGRLCATKELNMHDETGRSTRPVS